MEGLTPKRKLGAIRNDFESEDGPKRFRDSQRVTVAGIVSAARTRTTKNNTLMSYITLEDDTGDMELIAFQKVLELSGELIVENAALLVDGRISLRDEKEPQLMVDAIRPLTEDLDILGEYTSSNYDNPSGS